MTSPVSVACRETGDGWSCLVRVGDDPAATTHEVTVSREVLARLRPDASAPDELVAGSFAFLLAREPRESILRAFDLPVIGRYFPEWETVIR
jgi:hypothetical protein